MALFQLDSEKEELFASIRERITVPAKKRIQGDAYQDVVQETMLVLNRKLDEIGSRDQILPFTFGILRNCIGNYYQRIRREGAVIDFSAEVAAVRTSEPSDSLDWHDVIDKGLRLLEKQHAKCADLLRMVLRSASIEEMKKLLQTDEANVYRTLYRCRMRLKEIVTVDLKVKLP